MFIELLVVKEGKQIDSSLIRAHPSIALNSNQIPYLYFTYMKRLSKNMLVNLINVTVLCVTAYQMSFVDVKFSATS